MSCKNKIPYPDQIKLAMPTTKTARAQMIAQVSVKALISSFMAFSYVEFAFQDTIPNRFLGLYQPGFACYGI